MTTNKTTWAAFAICVLAITAGGFAMLGAILGSWTICLNAITFLINTATVIEIRETAFIRQKTAATWKRVDETWARVDEKWARVAALQEEMRATLAKINARTRPRE